MTEMQQAPEPAETDRTNALKILEKSYDEILDATKHQDDKIGRILTGTAFLTAAALAFANQAHIGIATRFAVSERRLPLLGFAVGAFVVGVVLAASLLLVSLTTGLTLPGSAPRKERKPGARSSLLYFYSIAQFPKQEWEKRWEASAAVLEKELRSDYVYETYNLAHRTNHKYTRTNEAAAVLTLAFFALGVAFVLGSAIAVTSSRVGTAVPLTWQARVALAAFVATYTGIQIRAARRESLLRTWIRGDEVETGDKAEDETGDKAEDETGDKAEDETGDKAGDETGDKAEDERRQSEFKVYQYSVPVAAAALVLPGRDAPSRLVCAIAFTAAVAFVVTALRRRPDGVRVRVAAVVGGAAVVALVMLFRDETWRLLLAPGAPLLLTVRRWIDLSGRAGPPEATPQPPTPSPPSS